MNKEQTLDLLMLLSAIESWSVSAGKIMPDYLYENLQNSVDLLAKNMVDE